MEYVKKVVKTKISYSYIRINDSRSDVMTFSSPNSHKTERRNASIITLTYVPNHIWQESCGCIWPSWTTSPFPFITSILKLMGMKLPNAMVACKKFNTGKKDFESFWHFWHVKHWTKTHLNHCKKCLKLPNHTKSLQKLWFDQCDCQKFFHTKCPKFCGTTCTHCQLQQFKATELVQKLKLSVSKAANSCHLSFEFISQNKQVSKKKMSLCRHVHNWNAQ